MKRPLTKGEVAVYLGRKKIWKERKTKQRFCITYGFN